MSEFLSTSLSVGTTVVTITLPPITSSVIPDGPSTTAAPAPGAPQTPLVEVFTDIFTSTFIITGLSVETHTISPLHGSISIDGGFSQPSGDSILSPTVRGGPSSSSSTSSTTSNLERPSSTSPPTLSIPSSILPPNTTATTTVPSGVAGNSGQDISPGVGTSHQGPDESHKLAHILPAIFIPLAFVIVLTCLALRRYQRKFTQKRLAPLPFNTHPVDTTPPPAPNLEIALQVSQKETKRIRNSHRQTTTLVNQHGPTVDRLEDQMEIPRSTSLGPLRTASSDDPESPLVPAIQAQILCIQARLAEIEERHPDASPPLYSTHVEER